MPLLAVILVLPLRLSVCNVHEQLADTRKRKHMPASCNKDMIRAGRDRGKKGLSQVGR
jgi:hypothetical protein